VARRNRPERPEPKPLSAGTVRQTQEQADGQWVVSTWTARPGGRMYVCPICDGGLAAATAHLVVWPADRGSDERRHVHTACWRRRGTQRHPGRW
jgi:hypothetical protein